MGNSKLLHYIVDQIRDILAQKGANPNSYKFQKTSSGNIRIMDRQTCKSCILYLDEFDKYDILENSSSWSKHVNNVVCKIVDYGCDEEFTGKKCKRTIRGIIGPFNNSNKLVCNFPVTINDKITGEQIIIPSNNYIDKITFKRSKCHGYLTEGTSILVGLSEVEHPNVVEDFQNLQDEPGILSDDLNNQLNGNVPVFVENIQNKNSTLPPNFLVVKCGLGKEINSGAVDILVDIIEFQ